MDREVNDLRSGVRFNRRSGSLSGFSLCASAIREHRGDKATPGGGGPGDPGSPGGSKMLVE